MFLDAKDNILGGEGFILHGLSGIVLTFQE